MPLPVVATEDANISNQLQKLELAGKNSLLKVILEIQELLEQLVHMCGRCSVSIYILKAN